MQGEYRLKVLTARTERSEIRTKKTEGSPEQARGSLHMSVIKVFCTCLFGAYHKFSVPTLRGLAVKVYGEFMFECLFCNAGILGLGQEACSEEAFSFHQLADQSQ